MTSQIVVFICLGLLAWWLNKWLKKPNSKPEYHAPNDQEDRVVYRTYEGLDDWKKDLTILWEGTPIIVEFTHVSQNGKNRRRVKLEKVATNPRKDLYLMGYCFLRQEERTFKLDNVTTKILYKSRRYDHWSFLEDVLGINAQGYTFGN